MPSWDAFAAPGDSVPLVTEPQGETIAFDRYGEGYYTLSEGTYEPLYYFQRVPLDGDANHDGAVDLASRIYKELLRMPPLDVDCAGALYIGAADAPSGLAVVDRQVGRALDQHRGR